MRLSSLVPYIIIFEHYLFAVDGESQGFKIRDRLFPWVFNCFDLSWISALGRSLDAHAPRSDRVYCGKNV